MKTIHALLPSLLFILGMLPAASGQVSTDKPVKLTQLHANVWQYILGDRPPDMAEVEESLHALDGRGTWPHIDYSSKERGAWQPREHLSRLLDITRAYRSPGNRYYQQKEISRKIHLALNYWLENDFQSPNWWYPDIGVPMVLGPILILLEDELSETQLERGVYILNRSEIGKTGQNKVWLSGNVLFRTLLTGDVEMVDKAAASIREELVVSMSEGVQPDWSYHQHGPQLQFGNYGLSYAADMAKWLAILRNTPFQFDEEKVYILRNYLLDGQRWVSWKDKMDISACGRQLFIDSPSQKAGSLATTTAKMGQLDPEFAAAYRDANRYETLSGHKHFWRSDFQVIRNPAYYFSVKMCSKRVSGAESCNSENMLGYHMGDGVGLLYQSGTEYTNIFPFWDWKKVPGTTIIQSDEDLPVLTCSGYHIDSDFVGGLSDGSSGVAVLAYNRDGLRANKAWFMLDDKVVCLGNGITADTEFSVTTAINQAHLQGDVLVRAGKQKHTAGASEALQDPDWILHDKLGYLFPAGGQVRLETKPVSGSWHRVAIRYPEDYQTAPIFKLWMEHGTDPQNENYQYILVPGAKEKVLKKLSRKAPFTIRNEAAVQSVSTAKGNQAGIIFYEAGSSDLFGGIRADQACIVLLKKDKGQLQVSVADPTQQLEELHLTISGDYNGPYATNSGGQTQLTVPLPQDEAAGSTINVTLTHR
ncbi:polysaccharide lyase 8 family protein [Flavilitoribacter nigricans]|nr:polysaccharide lyase 8 family protein [Flavilitoribacter nigricans]